MAYEYLLMIDWQNGRWKTDVLVSISAYISFDVSIISAVVTWMQVNMMHVDCSKHDCREMLIHFCLCVNGSNFYTDTAGLVLKKLFQW